ncbi:hypothetical protein HJG60_009199 [Phyllostomus discolor]|uniref:Uncharacterized protein n=1 Tax=Phyllostomus discolor TaxID=89673 RepID=A0A834DCX5_9CHIR|nr:hypothetical protein HJG60_009199 [Phyllostomus discolor]
MKSPAPSGAVPEGRLWAGPLRPLGGRQDSLRRRSERTTEAPTLHDVPRGAPQGSAPTLKPPGAESAVWADVTVYHVLFCGSTAKGSGAAGLAGEGCVLTAPWGRPPSDLSSGQQRLTSRPPLPFIRSFIHSFIHSESAPPAETPPRRSQDERG